MTVALNGRLGGATVLLAIAACALVLVKTVRPQLVCAGLFLVIFANELVADPKAVIIVAYVWLFDIAVEWPPREAVIYVLWVGGALCVAHIVGARLSFATLSVLVYALWSAVVVEVGTAVHSHRLYVASVEDRAVRAERSKEEAVLRRVAEERLRIARELHDVVAHHIAVVGMQVNLAQARLSGGQIGVDTALEQARRSTHSVILEMQDILHVLREMGLEQNEGLLPAHVGTSEFDQLVRSFAMLEDPPQLTLEGSPPLDIPPSVDLAGHPAIS
ncbi:sensor histidine kinase [Rhodococcus qingshengii]|uniref:sensor histidine kinase n=1 Tax=Rhodococcus qingshengii TaxID=334542 RepID=UPI0035E025F2